MLEKCSNVGLLICFDVSYITLTDFQDKEDIQRTKWLWNKGTRAERQRDILKDTIIVTFICQQNTI